jgi:type I restriction enzyme S subunit
MELKAGYKQTEVGVIPDDWNVSTVGEEFSIQLGKMLDSEKNVGIPKPFLGNRAVQWGRIDLTDIGLIKLTPSDLQRFRLRNGDLLVCEGGDIGRAAIWQQEIPECYYQKALHRLRPKRGYDVRLMLNVLQRLSSIGLLQNFVTQTSIAHLPKDKFETVPIPHPPTAGEQDTIAEALSDVSGLIESIERLIAKKRKIKQGAIQGLLTGKKRLPGFEVRFGYKQTEIGSIPVDWEVAQLGKHAKFKTGPFGSALHQSDYVDNGVPVVNPMQILDGKILATTAMSITEAAARKLSDFRLSEGDVIIGRRGEMGRCAFVRREEHGWLCGTGSMIIRTESSLNSQFIQRVLASPPIVAQIQNASVGTTMVNLNQSTLANLVLPIPPTKIEQKAIASILSDMDADIAALETKLTKVRNLKRGLMQELLTGRTRLV